MRIRTHLSSKKKIQIVSDNIFVTFVFLVLKFTQASAALFLVFLQRAFLVLLTQDCFVASLSVIFEIEIQKMRYFNNCVFGFTWLYQCRTRSSVGLGSLPLARLYIVDITAQQAPWYYCVVVVGVVTLSFKLLKTTFLGLINEA